MEVTLKIVCFPIRVWHYLDERLWEDVALTTLNQQDWLGRLINIYPRGERSGQKHFITVFKTENKKICEKSFKLSKIPVFTLILLTENEACL